MSSIEKRLRKLAADCDNCRAGFCCLGCLCCMPEDAVQALVREAQEADEQEQDDSSTR